ncbi:MAG: response regulator [Anaerolineae bacterium]|nr:response regulator [Anaerolineae bacterium]
MSLEYSGYKILVVDDNPANLSVLVDYLIKYGFEVLTARNGTNGIEKAQYVLPDLILLDIVMPGIDGFETCRRLKADPATQDIPIIFMTSLTNTQDKINGFEAGGVDYITKPLQQAEVLARMTLHLQLRNLTRELHLANIKLAEQVQVEQEKVRDLTQRNTMIGQAVEASREAVVMGNSSGEVLYLNPAFSHLFGYTAVDLPVMNGLATIFANPDQVQAMFTAIQHHQFWQGEVNLQTKSRQTLTALVRTACIADAAGQVTSWVSLITDISAYKQALTKLEQQRQKMRRLSARLAETQEVERKRLARELHDRIGQNLFTSDVLLNIIRGQTAQCCPDNATLAHHINDLSALINQTTTHVRDVMAELRPPMLDDHGLVATLEWYGHQFSQWFGISVAVQGIEPEPRLPDFVENALFRITQEALTNVAKHAQATQATILLKVEPRKVSLSVKDDGIGFKMNPTDATVEARGWGLAAMTERAEAAGGRCRISARVQQGTEVTVEVPR